MTNQDTENYRSRQISEYRNHGDSDDDESIMFWNLTKDVEGAPLEGLFRDDKHDADKRSDRNSFYQRDPGSPVGWADLIHQ